jgi:O-antigen ligase
MLFALLDAVNPEKTASIVLPYIRFAFAGLFVLDALQNEASRRRLWTGVVVVASFWCIDALLQYLLGHDILGYPHDGKRLMGVFYPKALLGIMTAIVLPILVDYVLRSSHRFMGALVILLPAIIAIILSRNRNAWFTLGLSVFAYLIYLARTDRRIQWPRLLAAVTLSLSLVFAAALQQPAFRATVKNTFGLFSGNYATMDRATSHRLPLWVTALNMAQEHWVNGVGPRGYRYLYQQYAQPNDFYVKKKIASGITHPHQFFLEITVETGVIGVLGYCAFLGLLYQRLRRLDGGVLRRTMPWLLCAGVAVLPINSHMAFYDAFWSSVVWWLLSITLAMTLPARPP